MGEEKRGPEVPTVEILGRETAYEGFFRLECFRLRHRLAVAARRAHQFGQPHHRIAVVEDES